MHKPWTQTVEWRRPGEGAGQVRRSQWGEGGHYVLLSTTKIKETTLN